MAEELGMRMRLDGVVETTSGIRLTGDETEKLARRLDTGSKAMDGMAMSAKQTRQAMRELPMQFTDIATSLASGMPAWMVFIQQGGQIRDRFGGVAPALQAIASTITPLSVALGGGAAALGLVTAGFVQGQSEAFNYHKAIVLTGNASGKTAEQMQMMARALAEISGSQSENAAAMAALASTGRVFGDALELATRAAVSLENVAGVAVKDTVRQFADLGKDPVKASAALNEQTNFLTQSLFDQIQRLKEQGKESEAAKLAQTAYANTIIQRAEELDARLGNLQKAWRSVGDGAKWAWDQMLNVGRPDTTSDAMAKLKAVADGIENQLAKNLASGGGEAAAGRGLSQNDVLRGRLNQLRQELVAMANRVDKETTNAMTKAQEAAKTRDYIDKQLHPGNKGAKPKGELMDHPLTFDDEYPKADIAKIIAQRDSVRAARVAELQSYDATEKRMAADRIREEAALRAEREKTAEAYYKAIQEAEEAWAKVKEREEEANRRRSEHIAEGIYDGIVNGFAQGQTVGDLFIRELKTQFARTVLRMPVEFISNAFHDTSTSIVGALMGLVTGAGYGTPETPGINPQDRRASGGPMRARGLAEVAEEGPELLRVGGRSYLMMGSKDGYVHSASATRAIGGGRSMSNTFNISIDSRTDSAQIHQLVVRAVQMGQADLLQKMDRGEV